MTLHSSALVDELRKLVQGPVYSRSDDEFKTSTAVFNGNVTSPSKAVVQPINTNDVSLILKFCARHGLSPSVKAGGFGTAGWSVNGDITLDLVRLNDLRIDSPNSDGGFSNLRDTPRLDSKGKAKAQNHETGALPSNAYPADATPSTHGKRQRTPDPTLPRNAVVANFLRLPNLPAPAVRRRLEQAKGSNEAERIARVCPSDSSDSNTSERSSDSFKDSEGTRATSASSVSTTPEEHRLDSKLPETSEKGELSSASGGLAQPISLLDISATNIENASTLPSETSSSFSVRSTDPFGYMFAPSQSPNAPSQRPPRGFEQEAYPSRSTMLTTASTPTAASSSQHITSSSSNGESRPRFTPTPAPIHSKAYVSFGAGVKQKDIDLFTNANALLGTSEGGSPTKIPYHVPLAAHPVGSSVMMLGGFGFLSRLHGLSIDSLVEAEMVLADGTVVFVSENENPDLWWALRGAGPAFGVVTRYKAIAYPVPIVFAGNLIYNFRLATAASLIKHFRDCIKSAPRELYANVLLTAGPAGQGSLIVVQLCYIGTQAEGRAFLQAIASWDGEPCLLNEVCEKSFLSQQDSVAQILRGQAGRQWFIRSALINSLPDDIIYKTVNEFANTPVGCTWLFELAGGAVADNDTTCLPRAQREASFTIAAFHQWEMGDHDPLCVITAENWVYETLKPVSVGGPYPAFLGRHEKAERVIACYGDNWDRLKELKREYDPSGMFRNTLWPLNEKGDIRQPVEIESVSPPSEPYELPAA